MTSAATFEALSLSKKFMDGIVAGKTIYTGSIPRIIPTEEVKPLTMEENKDVKKVGDDQYQTTTLICSTVSQSQKSQQRQKVMPLAINVISHFKSSINSGQSFCQWWLWWGSHADLALLPQSDSVLLEMTYDAIRCHYRAKRHQHQRQ